MNNKVISQIWHIGLASAGLASIFAGWQAGGLENNSHIMILTGAGFLTLLISFTLARLTSQTFILPTNLATLFCTIVIIFMMAQFGISLPNLLLYATIGMVGGVILGFARDSFLIFLYPVTLIVAVLVGNLQGWFTLAVPPLSVWQLCGMLILFLLLFSVLAANVPSSVAYFTGALVFVFFAIWFSPLASIESGTIEKVNTLSWVTGIILFLLIYGSATAPVYRFLNHLRLAPRAEATIFNQRVKQLLNNGSQENIKALNTLYSHASLQLRKSIFTLESIQGNEIIWGKVIQEHNTNLGKEALKYLSALPADNSSTLHASLVKIFSHGVADSRASVWKASLKKLVELDTHEALQVCKQLAVNSELGPLEVYTTANDDKAFLLGLKAMMEVITESSGNLLTPVADFLNKEMHNSSMKRAAIVLQGVKNSEPVRNKILERLSSQFRDSGQSRGVDILKDILMIAPELIEPEVEWAALHGARQHILNLLQLDDEMKINCLTRFVNCVKNNPDDIERVAELCLWLKELIPANSANDKVYTAGLKAIKELFDISSVALLAPVAEFFHKEVHNSSAKRAAIALQQVKNSKLISAKMSEELSHHFRNAGQGQGADVLKDILLIAPQLIKPEVEWAAIHGTRQHILNLFQLDNDQLNINCLARLVNCVETSAGNVDRAAEICLWLGEFIPASSTNDQVYAAGLKAMTELLTISSVKLLAPIAEFFHKEIHNSSTKRAAIALQEVKNSKLISNKMAEELSNQFRNEGQGRGTEILKDIQLIDLPLIDPEVDWAAIHGSRQQVLDFLRLDDDQLIINCLSRLVSCVKANAVDTERATELCLWLGKLIPAKSTQRSVAILLAMCILKPQQTLRFLQEDAHQWPVQILQQGLGHSNSPLRPILWQWLQADDVDQSKQAVTMVNWIAN